MLLTALFSSPSKQLWMLLTVLLSLPKLFLCICCVQMSEKRIIIVHCYALTLSLVSKGINRGCIMYSGKV